MSLLLGYHDRKRAVVVSDDRAVYIDDAGVKQRRPGRIPKFQIIESASSQQKLILGAVGRMDLVERLMRGTARMVAERGLGLLELSAILPHFARKALAERKAATLKAKDDKIDLCLLGYDHVGLRIRSFVWRTEDDFQTIETTSDLSNRVFALGAFDVSNEGALHNLTQHMVGAKHRHANWIASQLRDAANELHAKWPIVIGQASFYAGIDSVGLIPLANEFIAPHEEFAHLAAGRLFIGRIATAILEAGYFFIGSIKTPESTAPDTYGNADGGVGAQIGGVDRLYMSSALVSGAGGSGLVGNGSATDLAKMTNGVLVDYGTLRVDGNGHANEAIVLLSGPPGIKRRNTSLTLKIRCRNPTNNLSPGLERSGHWAVGIPQVQDRERPPGRRTVLSYDLPESRTRSDGQRRASRRFRSRCLHAATQDHCE